MAIKRRDFLKVSLGAAAGCIVGTGETRGNENFEGWPDRYGMLTDTTICIGANCRKCEEACKKVNGLTMDGLDLSDNSVFEEKRRTDADNFTVVNQFTNPQDSKRPIYVKDQCRHCDEPACASACLVSAFTKTPEGPVIYNPDVCIGCRYCMIACPYDIPAYEYFNAFDPKIRKCTMCYDLVKEGKIPACANICPKEAITFGKRSDLIALARDKIRKYPDRYNPHIFGEDEVGGSSWLYLAGTDFSNIGFHTNLGTKPYPELTRGFLSSVPLVLTIWPALLAGFYKFTQRSDDSESDVTTKHLDGGE